MGDRAGVSRAALGHPRVHLRRTDSTNDRARELAIAGAPHGTLVTASEQTAGRGRHGRRWSSPPGSSLLMSLLLRSRDPPDEDVAGSSSSSLPTLSLLPLIAAVAVCDVVGERAQIKWPNDIVLLTTAPDAGESGLGKLAGILAEGRPQARWAVLGIGLNVSVRLEELPAGLQAATLGQPPEQIEPTLERLLIALERRLGEPALQALAEWRRRDVLRGREVYWGESAGRAEGIDAAGRLLVALPDGSQVALGAGEVRLRQIR